MNLHVNLPEFEPSDSSSSSLYFSQPLMLALAASIGLHVVCLWYLLAEGKPSAAEKNRGTSVRVTIESQPPATRQTPVFPDSPEAVTTTRAQTTATSAAVRTPAARPSTVPAQPPDSDSPSAVEATIPRDLSGYLQPADTHWSDSTPDSAEISTGRERVIFDPRLKTRLGRHSPASPHLRQTEISFRAQNGSQSVQLDNGRCFSVRDNQQWGETAIWWHTACGNKKYEMEFEYNPR